MIGQDKQGATPLLPLFDEKPIGNNNKFDIPEYADNEHPTMLQENYVPEQKPLAERLRKNILKTKKEALEELLTLVKSNPKEFEPYADLATDFLAFKDPVVQDRGLRVLILYLNDGNELNIDPKNMIKTVIEKCLCIQKEEIRHNSEHVLYWYMDNKYEELLLQELNDYLLSKNRKLVATSILFITNLLNNYGIKRMKFLEQFLKNLQFLSAPAKPIAKAETVLLFKEVYRWIGQNCLKDFKMHPEVKDELIKFSREYEKVPMEIKRGVAKKTNKQGQSHKPVFYMEEQECQNTEPIDVLGCYNSQWVDQLLKLEKWKEKKVALEQFIKKTKVPCILPPRESAHFIFLIKKLLADNNINISYCGFSIAQNLAKGLKKDFSHIAKNVLSQIYNKIKDLKAMTVELAQTTLKSLLNSLTIDDFLENIKDGLNDKSPQMKEETLKFLSNFFNKKDIKTINIFRSMLDKIIQLTEDGSAKVRSQALECLCGLKINHGMKLLGQKMKQLDPKKLQVLELAKEPVKEQKMEIEQVAAKPTSESTCFGKESNTVKVNKSSSGMQPQQPPKSFSLPKPNTKKNDESSSVNSSGDNKVLRSLNLSYLQDISSSSQAIRQSAYQQLSNKFLAKDLKQFMKQIKVNSVKQSSPVILKHIISIAKKHAGNGLVELEVAQFVLKHDWKKCKQMLQQFTQTSRFTPEAEELIRSSSSLNSGKSTTIVQNINPNAQTIKSFYLELHNSLITKMTNPLDSVKKQAAERAISIWENIPKISSEAELTPNNGWHEQIMGKLFNIIKCRLSEPNQEIVALYCRLLLEMINKGITVKQKIMKTAVQTVYNNLGKGNPEVKNLFKEMVNNSPSHMFSTMLGEIYSETSRDVLVEFIVENTELFIKYADLKAFINPFLHILCTTSIEMKLKQGLDAVFTQMVEIEGESALEKEVAKLKVSNIEAYNQYLARYNICLNKNSYANTGKNYRIKEDRLKYWEEEQWNLEITSNHILKLVNLMVNLGEPLSCFCTLGFLTDKHISDLNSIEFNSLSEYSDIFFKYIYWRTIIDSREIVEKLIKFESRLILVTNYLIPEIDIIVLMRTCVNLIQRFQGQLHHEIVEVLKRLFSTNSALQNDTLPFWINHLAATNQEVINEILCIFISCYENSLPQHLVQLARFPSVHKHDKFMRFLQNKFNPQHLVASGFRITTPNQFETASAVPRQRLVDLGGPDNMLSIDSAEINMILDMFTQNSQNMLNSLMDMTCGMDLPAKVEKYVKILYSITAPFFRGEIQIINMFTFMKELNKILQEPYHTKKIYLKQLTRMLIFLLVDLDQVPPHGTKCQEIIRIVNKCALVLVDTSEARHMLEVLFLLAKRQLELNITPKVVQLIIKCVGKTVRNNSFHLNAADNINYILQENNNIFHTFDLKSDSAVIKSFKIVFSELFKLYPISVELAKQLPNSTTVHPNLKALIEEHLGAQQIGNPEPEQLPLREQNRDAVNGIKAMGPSVLDKIPSLKNPFKNSDI